MKIAEVDRERIDALLPLVQADQMGIDPDSGQWLAACDDRGNLIGVARVTEIGGSRTIDDIWVTPEHRRGGIARALIAHAGRPLWLICDEDMIGFYERGGFRVVAPAEFPAPLADLYGSRGEWPGSADHVHFAMLLD
jgi:GNAT superfamily N-acetyltransferase